MQLIRGPQRRGDGPDFVDANADPLRETWTSRRAHRLYFDTYEKQRRSLAAANTSIVCL